MRTAVDNEIRERSTSDTAPTIVIEDESLRLGFTQLPNYLFQVRGLSHGAKLTYALILSYAWQKDYCFPGQESLARDLEVSTRSVIDYLKELQGAQLIRVQRRGLGLTNIYHVLKYSPMPTAPDAPSQPKVKKASDQGLKPVADPQLKRVPDQRVSGAASLETQPSADKVNPAQTITMEKIQKQQQGVVVMPIAESEIVGQAARSGLERFGIRQESLLRELLTDPSEVFAQIEALHVELSRGKVDNPAGWLVGAIRGQYRREEAFQAPLVMDVVGDDSEIGRGTWAAICREVQQEVTGENYRRWFVSTKVVTESESQVVVAVDDEFHLRWLDSRLRGVIERAALRLQGNVVDIQFVIDGEEVGTLSILADG